MESSSYEEKQSSKQPFLYSSKFSFNLPFFINALTDVT